MPGMLSTALAKVLLAVVGLSVVVGKNHLHICGFNGMCTKGFRMPTVSASAEVRTKELLKRVGHAFGESYRHAFIREYWESQG